MKEKILNALKTKYKTLGLSDKAFDGVAEFYSKTVTEESNLDEFISGLEPVMKSMQSEADRVRTDSQSTKSELEAKIKELEVKLQSNQKPNPPQGGGADDDNAEIAALKRQMQDILDRQSQADKAKNENSLKESAKKMMIAKGVKETLCDEILGNYTISESDTPESISEFGVTKYNNLKSAFTPEPTMPQAGISGGGDDVLDEYFAKKKAENESKN